MKKLIFVILISLFLVGCEGLDNDACRDQVKLTYPNSAVIDVPDTKYEFIVVTDTRLIYVETKATGTEITLTKILYDFKSPPPKRYETYGEMITVKSAFPNGYIFNLPNEKYKFIVINGMSLEYVETTGTSSDITKHVHLYDFKSETLPVKKTKSAIDQSTPVHVIEEKKPMTKREWVLNCIKEKINSEECMRLANRLF